MRKTWRLLTFALALTAWLPAAAEYTYESSFGTAGSLDGRFNEPRGVTVESGGEIVVADAGNNRIQVCSYAGDCSSFGTPGTLTGEFDKPRGLDWDSNAAEIVIADRGNDRMQFCKTWGSCDSTGGSGTAVGQFESPRGIAVLSATQVVVADTENNRIQICTRAGSCTAFGSLGSSPGQFDGPAGVAVNSQGRIIVADRMNNRIQVCTSSGSCSAFGSSGTAPGRFNSPTGIAVDSQDNIVVVDRFNHRVQICTSGGSCTAFGSQGSANGQFQSPWGVAVDSQDRIIVSDSGNSRIQVFSDAPAVDPVSITAFSASPTTIEAGQTTRLSWSVDNATSCTPSGGTGGWSGKTIDAAGGSTLITATSAGSYTFTLTCSGGGATDSASANLTVNEAPPPFYINAGISDAWYFPETSGQGFFIIVWEDLKTVFLSWFTYDTERPPADTPFNLGEPGHRWLTAQGTYDNDTAMLDVFVSRGGVFDSPDFPVETLPDGTMEIRFTNCGEGVVSYFIESLGLSGEVPIQRIVPDNVPLCESLNAPH